MDSLVWEASRHSTPGRMIESLEPRRLFAANLFPSVTGLFAGGLLFDGTGATDNLEIDVDFQRGSHFSGSFQQGDGSVGRVAGTVNKRGVTKFNYFSTNLFTNFRGKAKADFDPIAETISGLFSTKTGKHKSTGSFSVTKFANL